MQKKSENKLIMLKALLRLLKQNEPAWINLGPLATVINELVALIEQIEGLLTITESTNSGLVVEKQIQQEVLINRVFELASMLFALSKRINDQVLLAKVDFPISELKNLRYRELANYSRKILTLGQEYSEKLVEYSTSPEDLAELENLISNYEEELPAVRVTVSERKAANEKLKILFKEANNLLNDQLDRLMIKVKSTNPDFYASYLNARKVVDYGVRHEKAEVNAEVKP